MIELLRTNDPVLVSFAQALLRDAGLRFDVLDVHMCIVEGSLGILPRRLAVHEDDASAARTLLVDAGIDVPPVGESRG